MLCILVVGAETQLVKSKKKIIKVINKVENQHIKDYLHCENFKKKYSIYKNYNKHLRFPINNIEVADSYSRLTETLRQAAIKCQNGRFRTCFKNNRKYFDLDKLNRLFQTWIKDYRFRHFDGAFRSSERTNSLAFELAQIGYSAKKIRIHHAPVLIVFDYDKQNKLTGEYYNYQGNHSLLQVMVKIGDKLIPYFLDTQFMHKPIMKKKYFLKTIGQDCIEKLSFSAKSSFSSLNCYFTVRDQNYSEIKEDPVAVDVLTNVGQSCGWHFDVKKSNLNRKKLAKLNNMSKSLILKSMTNDTIPFELKGKIIGPEVQKILIIKSYTNYQFRLKELIDTLSDQIFMIEESIKSGGHFSSVDKINDQNTILLYRLKIKQTNKDIAGIAEKILEIKSNLNSI
jgi:hypothetical protein